MHQGLPPLKPNPPGMPAALRVNGCCISNGKALSYNLKYLALYSIWEIELSL